MLDYIRDIVVVVLAVVLVVVATLAGSAWLLWTLSTISGVDLTWSYTRWMACASLALWIAVAVAWGRSE